MKYCGSCSPWSAFANSLDALDDVVGQFLGRDLPLGSELALAIEALDHGVGEEAVAQRIVLHRLLVEAGGRVGDDVGMIGSVAEPLVVGVAGMAGIDQQYASAFGRLDGLLQDLPVHHGGAEKGRAVPHGIGR